MSHPDRTDRPPLGTGLSAVAVTDGRAATDTIEAATAACPPAGEAVREPAEAEATEDDDWEAFQRMFAPHPPYRPSDDHSYAVGSLLGGHS